MDEHDFAALTLDAHEEWTLFAVRIQALIASNHLTRGVRAGWDSFLWSKALPRRVAL